MHTNIKLLATTAIVLFSTTAYSAYAADTDPILCVLENTASTERICLSEMEINDLGLTDDDLIELDAIAYEDSDQYIDSGTTAPLESPESSEMPLESAPIENYAYSSWELLHRTPMIAGFMWTGAIAQYITPAMYIGTPFANTNNVSQGIGDLPSYISDAPTTYRECLAHEAYISFGLGDRIESSDIRELKSINKSCAKEFLGSYFDGKEYATREEFLMMLMTLFDDEVTLQGEFYADEFISNGVQTVTRFVNVRPTAWYAPYLEMAEMIGLTSEINKMWDVGSEITDELAIEWLMLYTIYRNDFDINVLEQGGQIVTNDLIYTIFLDENGELHIEVE